MRKYILELIKFYKKKKHKNPVLAAFATAVIHLKQGHKLKNKSKP
jgi:hypothetical protein